MNKKKWLLVVVLFSLVISYFVFDLGAYLNLEFFKAQQQQVDEYYQQNPFKTALIFFIVYVIVTGLSLPGAVIMTLVGAAIFGLLWGTVIVSFASTIGATLAFLVARFLLRDPIQNKFAKRLKSINAGVDRDGAFYLFTLRLIPVFPFFVINILMGLTTISLSKFFFVSQIGMLPGTLVYVNAGTQLAKINSIDGILSPGLLIAFALLGIFPIVAKYLVAAIKNYKSLKQYKKPDHYDYNLIVIGAGSAGLVSAYIAAAVKSEVALIEKHRMGGDCLNTGCVPSKALIRTARFLHQQQRAAEFGCQSAHAEFDFAEVMERVQQKIAQIEPHDSVERYESLGVDCLQGEATITSPYSVSISGRTLTTRNIVVATGARPRLPSLQGLERVPYYTSDSIWSIRKQPSHLVVLGGGPIGCELAQAFARLGSDVSIVQRQAQLLTREDSDAAKIIEQQFVQEGIHLYTAHTAKEVIIRDGKHYLECSHKDKSVELEFDALLVALGRAANTEGFGLQELGIKLTESGTIDVNDNLQTSIPNIYACGDVAGPYQFTHSAAHQAWYCAVNSLFGQFKKFKVDYSVIPRVTYTDPEVASVGLTEKQADAEEIEFEVSRFELHELDRAIVDESTQGFVKVLTAPGKDRILGVSIVAEHGGEMLAEYVMAMKHKLGLNKILGTIHSYPTMGEANKYVAGNWKRAHQPEKVLQWVERYHRWRRS